jgi:hypothetical protein
VQPLTPLGPEDCSCADCLHTRANGEVLDEGLSIEARGPFLVAYRHACEHPNERVSKERNTQTTFREEEKGHAEWGYRRAPEGLTRAHDERRSPVLSGDRAVFCISMTTPALIQVEKVADGLPF